MSFFFSRLIHKRRARTHSTARALVSVERLETWLAPYALSGNAWPNPQLITISFEPDGTLLPGIARACWSTPDGI